MELKIAVFDFKVAAFESKTEVFDFKILVLGFQILVFAKIAVLKTDPQRTPLDGLDPPSWSPKFIKNRHANAPFDE